MKKTTKKTYPIIIGITLVLISALIIFASMQKNTEQNEIKNSNIYPTNSNGLTYGYAETTAYDELPDLIGAIGKNGTEAYMRIDDYLGNNFGQYEIYTIEVPPEDLEIVREQYAKQHPDTFADISKMNFYKKCYYIPLFDETGENEVDKFEMSMGYYPESELTD